MKRCGNFYHVFDLSYKVVLTILQHDVDHAMGESWLVIGGGECSPTFPWGTNDVL